MKRIKAKLQLDTHTVKVLQSSSLESVHGALGMTPTYAATCTKAMTCPTNTCTAGQTQCGVGCLTQLNCAKTSG